MNRVRVSGAAPATRVGFVLDPCPNTRPQGRGRCGRRAAKALDEDASRDEGALVEAGTGGAPRKVCANGLHLSEVEVRPHVQR